MKGLDDYIMGIHIHEEDSVRHVCATCGKIKFIPMFFDMGGWFYHNDDDPFCEDCEQEMVIVEAAQS